jgi:hypothetical protein
MNVDRKRPDAFLKECLHPPPSPYYCRNDKTDIWDDLVLPATIMIFFTKDSLSCVLGRNSLAFAR